MSFSLWVFSVLFILAACIAVPAVLLLWYIRSFMPALVDDNNNDDDADSPPMFT